MNNHGSIADSGSGNFGYRILLMLAFAVFAGFVGLSLWVGYSSQLQVRNTARELFVGESARRAMAVSFYFSNRVSELENVAARGPVQSLIDALEGQGPAVAKKDTGLVDDVCSLFNSNLARRSVGDELAYSRIALLDENGGLLVDSDAECVLDGNSGGFENFRVRHGTPAFFAGEYGGELSIVVSVPVDAAKGIRGTIVGWTRVESLQRSLGFMTVSPSVGSDFLRVGSTVVAVSDSSAQQSGQLLLMDALHEWNGLTILEAGQSGREVDYLAISSPVQGTSLSVISLVEEEKLFGFLSLRTQFLLSFFLFVVISGGCFWLVRSVLGRKVYEARMQEAAKRVEEVNRQKEKIEQEIKNRHLADALRRRAEIKFRDIFDNAPIGIFQATRDGSYLTANKALAQLYGYESSEELISNVTSVGDQVYVDSDDWSRAMQMLRLSGQVAGYEVECRRRDGSSIWTSRDFRLVEGEPGMPAYVEGFVINISARKKAEEKQLKSEWRFRSLFENSPVPLWELDMRELKKLFDSYGPDMAPVIREELLSDSASLKRCLNLIEIIDANNRTIEFFGSASREELISSGFSSYVTPHSWRFYRSIILDLLKGAQRNRSEFNFVRLDGKEQSLILNLNIVPGFESSWGRVLVSVEDISELKKIEKELRSSREEAQEANEAKGRFLANMTHEFRTPMNAVKGMVQLLQRSGMNAEQQENLRLIKSSVDSLLVIVNDILDYSKLDTVHMELNEENVDFPAFLQEMRDVVDVGAMNKPLQVFLEAEKVPECIRVDSLRLRQVLVNLLGNAVKFTDKGSVTLRCSPAPQSGLESKAYLLFEVSDTGIGLPEDAVDSLFKSFVQADPSITRRYGGTGLGLAICYKLVKHLGGELSARNNEQGGALFSFTLPVEVCSEVPAFEEGPELQTPVDLSGVKILVAEDSKMNRILLRKIFDKNGITDYVMVENGKDAVDTFTQSDDFDLIFMDIQMPVLDGFEAARAIRKTHSPVRIVALTANAGSEFLEKCYDSGMDSRITKPFNVDDLLAEVAKAASDIS
ncbi:PAS domain S-box protein [Desulfovibrio sp. JC010]|uniref:PAS domain-containing hybrid sensor histidine kinase/response regulator n=1 Tax=Desulfovibrio sp. JC010 TaxID=2593641 RepID=UPI0013D46512|nr:PAS domain S-box protein [Desulfovibrio sp. JC010]NDV27906.1 PAS domain S-box protein [Desulfovibrio sp. JC010]